MLAYTIVGVTSIDELSWLLTGASIGFFGLYNQCIDDLRVLQKSSSSTGSRLIFPSLAAIRTKLPCEFNSPNPPRHR